MKIKIFSFKKSFIFILLFFLFITSLFTFPFLLNMGSSISGFFSSDEPFAALWNFWWLKFASQNNLYVINQSTIAVPFAIKVTPSGYPFWEVVNRYLTILTSNIVAYNLQVFLSYLLSGIFMFYLVNNITDNYPVSLFSALIYVFSPYHSTRSWQHLGLAQIQWMPMYILTLFNLYKKLNKKNIFMVALGFTLVMNFDLYYAYFMFILTLFFLIFIFIFDKKINKIKFLKFLFLATLITFILTLPNLLNIFNFMQKSKIENTYQGVFGYIRPFKDLFTQSARPLSYFLPAAVHPLFGQFTEQFIGSSLYGESLTEHTLYLGWTPLILAFITFRRWKNKKLRVTSLGTVPFGDSPYNRDDFYLGFFVFLAIVAWLFSQPPWWKFGPIKIFMPPFFMYKILPMFRAYCRFGIVVMLAVSVLAGFGLKFILEKIKSQKMKITLTCLFSGLVLFEFWNWPPYKVIDVSRVPAVYYWLKEQPSDFAIAEYPLDIDGPNEIYKFYQTVHEKKIINGTIPGTYANEVAQTITKLSEPNTAGVLKWMGVKYVLVHTDDYRNTGLVEWIEELNMIPQNPALKLIKIFPFQDCLRKDIMCVQKRGPIDVYEITASPIKPDF